MTSQLRDDFARGRLFLVTGDRLLSVEPDGQAHFQGVQTGKMVVVAFNPGANPISIMLRESGQAVTLGRGIQSYNPTQYSAYQVTSEIEYHGHGFRAIVTPIISAPLRLAADDWASVNETIQRTIARARR